MTYILSDLRQKSLGSYRADRFNWLARGGPASSFVFGVIVAVLLLPAVVSVGARGSRLTLQGDPRHFKFKWDGSGRAVQIGASQASYSRYISEDGVLVKKIVEKYKSNETALTRFNQMKKDASKVIREGRATISDGTVGTYTILAFDSSDDVNKRIVIAWVDRARVFLIQSSSLPHAEDFKRQDFPSVNESATSNHK